MMTVDVDTECGNNDNGDADNFVCTVSVNTQKVSKDNVVLIWDTGAARHLFEYVPEGAFRIRDKPYKVLLGGSSKHSVSTTKVFSVGVIRDALLLPDDVRIGYNIISAGQLQYLRTVQDVNGKFYVTNSKGDVLSQGHIGEDSIFYLDDYNLLRAPRLARPSHRLQIHIIRNQEDSISGADDGIHDAKVNIVTRAGSGVDLKGVKRNPKRNPKPLITESSVVTPTVTSTKPSLKTTAPTSSVDEELTSPFVSVLSGQTMQQPDDKITTTNDADSIPRHRARTVAFGERVIHEYDATNQFANEMINADTNRVEDDIQTSGGGDNEEIDNDVRSDDNNDDSVVDEHNHHNDSNIRYSRKHTRYREYTSQPPRFKDDSNLMNFLHVRLGHQSDRIIKMMFKHNMITFLKDITYDKIKDKHSTPCSACESAKSTRRPSVRIWRHLNQCVVTSLESLIP
jgi:hypothetical protein